MDHERKKAYRVLFLTAQDLRSLNAGDGSGIYTDLLQEFVRGGAEVTVVSPFEKRNPCRDGVIRAEGAVIHKFPCGNITKNKSLVKKGIAVLLLKYQYLHCLRRFLGAEKFDLILYSTPPITLYRAVAYAKKRTGARTYLMLKDIWPHDMLGHKMLSERSPIYKLLLSMEKKLYRVSDTIGCMSPANVAFVKKCNPWLDPARLTLCPNSAAVRDESLSPEKKRAIREKYHLPTQPLLFVYGGSLGRPQGIDYIIDCLTAEKDNGGAFFAIVGAGAGYERLHAALEEREIRNAMLIPYLPRAEYDTFCAAADVGLIFLNRCCSVPNIPSRVLSYTASKLPVLAATDTVTDIGTILTENGFGWWCESARTEDFCRMVASAQEAGADELARMGERGFSYMEETWNAAREYESIMGSEGIIHGA